MLLPILLGLLAAIALPAFLGPQLIADALAKQPDVPDLPPLNLQQLQDQSISGNAAVVPKLTDLASKVNTFESGELLKRLNAMAPGYSNLLEQLRKTSQDQLSGNLSDVTKRQVAQFSAEQSAASGTSGFYGNISEFASNRKLRDFGLKVEEQIGRGIDSATRWLQMAQASKGAMFDFTNMFVRPQEQANFSFNERQQQFQRNFVANQIESQYDMRNLASASIRKTDDQVMAIAASVAGAYTGSLFKKS